MDIVAVVAVAFTLAGFVMGAINGILTVMTGSFMVPSILFMQAMGFQRHVRQIFPGAELPPGGYVSYRSVVSL